jgi:molecular chaperone GrpE
MRKVRDRKTAFPAKEVPEDRGDSERNQSSSDPVSIKRSDADKASPSDDVEKVTLERDEYYDLLLRKQAEFENYRKRITKEKSELVKTVKIELPKQLLPVIDACEKGIVSMREENSDSINKTFTDGYEMLLRELKAVLERNEVDQVPGEGETFDPNFHEAVVREMSKDFKEGEIIEEFRKGYALGDRLLRASQVKVAVWPEEAEKESQE